MNGPQKALLKVVLSFTPSGNLEEVSLLAGNDREETFLREAIKPALKAYCRGLTPKETAQWIFDLLRMRSL